MLTPWYRTIITCITCVWHRIIFYSTWSEGCVWVNTLLSCEMLESKRQGVPRRNGWCTYAQQGLHWCWPLITDLCCHSPTSSAALANGSQSSALVNSEEERNWRVEFDLESYEYFIFFTTKDYQNNKGKKKIVWVLLICFFSSVQNCLCFYWLFWHFY